MDQTKAVIAAMLKEPVATSFLDSGGTPRYDADGNYLGSTSGYGRHLERNQKRDFDAEPRATLRFYSGQRYDGDWYGGMDATINVYHYLVSRLTYAEALDRLFHEVYVPLVDDEDMSWFELSHRFGDFLELKGPWKAREAEILERVLADPLLAERFSDEWQELDDASETGYRVRHNLTDLGKRVSEFGTEYTYNVDNFLSRDVHYDYFEWDNEHYVILMVHGGCDARGGFTVPHVFECGYDGLSGYSDMTAGCENGHIWETNYDGYHFRKADIDSMQADWPDLTASEGDIEVIDQAEHERRLAEHKDAWLSDNQEALNYFAQVEAGQAGFAGMPMPERPNYAPPDTPYVWHDEAGVGHCPICGAPLSADFWDE